MFTIRKANLDDIRAIQEVCSQTWQATYHDIYTTAYIDRVIDEHYNLERLKQDVLENSSFWNGYWVAEKEGEILGCIAGGMDEKEHANVYVLYISPKAQRQGAGHLLLKTLTDYQKMHFNAKEQWVSVAEDNTIGIPFYEKEGFILDHILDNSHDNAEARDLQYKRDI